MLGLKHGPRFAAVVAVVLMTAMAAGATPAADAAVEAMKARVSAVSIGERAHLCVQIAEHQLAEADKLYATSDIENAQGMLTDVVAYSEMARDYSIQSHKYEKQTEIAVRVMTRKLTEVMHALAHDDQPPVREAITQLQRVRDDLLAAMFRKGAK